MLIGYTDKNWKKYLFNDFFILVIEPFGPRISFFFFPSHLVLFSSFDFLRFLSVHIFFSIVVFKQNVLDFLRHIYNSWSKVFTYFRYCVFKKWLCRVLIFVLVGGLVTDWSSCIGLALYFAMADLWKSQGFSPGPFTLARLILQILFLLWILLGLSFRLC